MTGLEAILAQIRKDGDEAAATGIEKARQEAAEMLERAKEQGNAGADQIARRAQEEYEDVCARAESAAALEKKKRLLEEKQAIISGLIGEARAYLGRLSETEYFTLLAKMAGKNALPQEGELILGEADIARLPAGFEAELAKELPSGAALKVCPRAGRLNGGFLLSYGGVEQNCGFDALFDAAREEMQDSVHELLFQSVS